MEWVAELSMQNRLLQHLWTGSTEQTCKGCLTMIRTESARLREGFCAPFRKWFHTWKKENILWHNYTWALFPPDDGIFVRKDLHWGVVLRIFADQIASHWKSFPAYMSGTEWPRVFPNHPPQRRHTRPHHQRRDEQSAGGSSGEKWGYGGTAAVMRAWISTVSVAIICSNYFAGQDFDCDTFFEKGEKNMSKNHAYLLKPSTAFY